MKTPKSYFFQSFSILLLAAAAFLIFKKVLPNKIFSEKPGLTKNVLVDSLMLEAVAEDDTVAEANDSTLAKKAVVFDETNGIVFPNETFTDYKGYQYLISFFEKLFKLETEQSGAVRIAYFGDSMTDGDMIVQDIRSNYQAKYGGQGVGFVSINSESAASRSTITHEFSKNWKMQSYLNVKRPIRPFGVNGRVFFANDTAHVEWVRYKANKTRFATELDNPTLFYGKSGNRSGSLSILVDKDTVKMTKKLNPSGILNTLQIAPHAIKGFKANFIHADSIPIYGFNFDDGKGVHVDNFSQRGNSGLPITTFNVGLMRAFQEKLDYDLIVLHYGTNVLNYGTKNYSWYEKSMTKVISHLRECFPNVPILIISSADKGTKYDLEMKTDSAVVPLTTAQKRYALNNKAGFINLYTLMGGDGSMVKWVEEVPAMANKDYTHFNFRGAKKVAEMLYGQLDQGYEQYKVLRKNKKITVKKAPVKKDSIFTQSDTTNAQ
ncbi:GDSL-type esterase/lipase family protein [Flavobacterium kingsejongi]|uniref:Uncharacterized protein n=1 Tax=Flavobacterium kingsejongi TaxID=1678728 RepID=A0A2S1LNV8_9FLAO|nr:GDSL-type esterase/lipase family protein [Flavobacterium kingsejongi]AWG25443.1 hypothetical protein FK004_09455 [Flavobacterium kingsejongi]